jgi:hypothetical protein
MNRAAVATREAPVRVRPSVGSGWRARIETSLIMLGFVFAFFVLRHSGIYGDGRLRFQALSDLLEHGHILNTKYSLVGPLFSAPLWMLGRVVENSVWWVERYNVLVLAAGALGFYFILRRHLDGRVIRRFLLILLTASMFPNHLKWYYGEVFTAACVGVGLAAVVYGRELGGWIAVTLGVANTPATLVGLGCVALKRALDRRRVLYVLIPLAPALLMLGENWLKRGDPLNFRYEAGFTYPWVFGVLSILFSFGAGLLFFTPGLVLWLRPRTLGAADGVDRKLASLYGLWIAFLLGMIAVYAGWWDWAGGWFWGPRYFLFASLPASLALSLRLGPRNRSLTANLLTLGVLLLSCWVGLDGAIFGTRSLEVHFLGYGCPATGTWVDNTCYYAPELSALWQPFVVASGVHWQWSAFKAVEQVGLHEILWTLYSLVVFTYLLTPLLVTVVRQGAAVIREHWIALRTTATLRAVAP